MNIKDNSGEICPYYREDIYEVQGIMYKMSTTRGICELKEQDSTMFNNCHHEKGRSYKNCRIYYSFIEVLNKMGIRNCGR